MKSSSLIKIFALTCLLRVAILTSCFGKPEFKIIPLYLDDTQTQTINGRRLTMRTDYFLVYNNSFNGHGIRDFVAD